MDIYNLGMVSWWESQCYYHALAYLGREGIILCRPAEPYVCLGFHDDLVQEIDQDFCRETHLPLLRRETGGGVVYLDSQQIFYQVVLHREHPLIPMKRDRLFAKVLQPAIDICRSLGLTADLTPPADITAEGRKCSGNAAGDIGDAVAYVGNLIIDFDFEVMSRILSVPSPGFRQSLQKIMQDSMLTLADKLGDRGISFLESGLMEGFERLFGKLYERALDKAMKKTAASVRDRLTSDEWLHMPGRRYPLRKIKIAEGLYLQETGNADSPILIRGDGMEVEAPPRLSAA